MENLSPSTSLGSQSEKSGQKVVIKSTGKYTSKRMIITSLIIAFTGTPVNLDDIYKNGAVGGVMQPMPRFTPRIAAN